MAEASMIFVYGNELRDDMGTVLGKFSSHWAACAAMIRLTDRSFVSLGGDKAADLAEEAAMRRSREGRNLDNG